MGVKMEVSVLNSRMSLIKLACKLAVIILPFYNLVFVLLWIWEQNTEDYENDFAAASDLGYMNDPSFFGKWWSSATPTGKPNVNSIKVYNITAASEVIRGEFSPAECLRTATAPSFMICVYPPDRDKFISAALLSDGLWEPYITPLFQKALRAYANATVLDVGANIGYYSLLAASMGHRVLAVEPSLENRHHLVEAVLMNQTLTKLITLSPNAISSSRQLVTLTSSPDNQGGLWIEPLSLGRKVVKENMTNARISPVINAIPLDDLSLYVDRTLIIKIDIEGFECRALAGARNLLKTRYIPYIFMEWGKMYKSRHKQKSPCPVRFLHRITEMMTSLGYSAHEVYTGFTLGPMGNTNTWRIGDLYWRHKSAYMLQNPY